MSIIKINQIDAFNLEVKQYNEDEANLLTSSIKNFQYNPATDFIEAKIYDSSKNLIYSDGEYSDDGIYSYFSISEDSIKLNVENFISNLGYGPGDYYIIYNFYRKLCSNNNMNRFEYYLSEIDSTRTELKIRLIGNNEGDFKQSILDFIKLRKDSATFVDFIVSFGIDNLLANNIKLNEDEQYLEIFIKLYEPLPPEFNINSKLLLLSEINNSVGYNVKLENEVIETELNVERIAKPNFNINVTDYSSIDSKELSLLDIQSEELFDINNQFQSLTSDQKYKINIDYTNFENFIHYSSSFKRIYNFIQKLRLIQNNEYKLTQFTLQDTHNKPLVDSIKNITKDIITSFDGYEYYLYYNLYPKDSNGKNINFLLDPLNNSESSEINPLIEGWYNQYCDSAIEFDENNLDNLYWNIPEYLRDDPKNYPYRLFIEMIGHSFDDIWVYIRNIKDLYKGDNRINFGISKELLTELLNNFGLKLYNGNFSTQDLYSSFLGTKRGVIPYNLMSFDLKPGSELIENYIDVEEGEMPLNDIEYRIFKRLYHNLPYLYKSRGTINALKTLINIYGIPEGTLTINEFGDDSKITTSENLILDSTLVFNQSLQQTKYSETIDDKLKKYISIGVSPQDQINKDIDNVYGDVDYNQLLGDPREFRKGDNKYQKLTVDSNLFFTNYVKAYNLKDFIRLARFLNNSLFKMLRDFVPASTTVSTGVIIKQHNLERIKTKPIDLDLEFIQYETLMKSFSRDYTEGDPTYASDDINKGTSIEVTSGGTGGVLEMYNNLLNNPYYANGDYGKDQIIQEWEETFPSKVGPIVYNRTDQREFYNGELGLPIIHETPEICRTHFSNEFLTDWRYHISFYGEEGDTTTEDEFLQTDFNLEKGKIKIFLQKTKFDNYENGEHLSPKYIKISNETITGDNFIDDFILSNSFMTLTFPSIKYWSLDPVMKKWNENIVEDLRSFKFTFFNVIKKGNTYLIILDQTNTDHVSGYSGGSSNNRTIFNAAGDYIWRSYGVFIDSPYKTIPQGYFPKTLPDDFKTQYFRGYAKSPYYEGNNLIQDTSINDVSGNYANFFNKGNSEVDGDAYNEIEYVGNLKNSTKSEYPWFMDGDSELIEIDSSNFELKQNIVQNGVGPITYLGVEFIPIGNINYSNIHQITTDFPASNTLDGVDKASLEVKANGVLLNSYEANLIKTYYSPAYPGDLINVVLNNAILPSIPTNQPSRLKTKIYNIGDNITPIAEIIGSPSGKNLVSTINTSLYPNYGGIKTEAFRSSLIITYADLDLTLLYGPSPTDENYPENQTYYFQLVVSNKPFNGKIKFEGQSTPSTSGFNYETSIYNNTIEAFSTSQYSKQFTPTRGQSGGTEFDAVIPEGTYNVMLSLSSNKLDSTTAWDANIRMYFNINGVNAEKDGEFAYSFSEHQIES